MLSISPITCYYGDSVVLAAGVKPGNKQHPGLLQHLCTKYDTIVSQPSKCLKFMTFREGCFITHVEYKYLSEAFETFFTVSFTKDDKR